VKIQPARLFRMTSKPMNTTTTASTGAFSTGRMTILSMRIPNMKAIPTVRRKAGQYGMPALIRLQAM
jgi:hypothetical protein